MATSVHPVFTPPIFSPQPRTEVGEYKELAPVSYSQDTELKGTAKFAPASFPHYLPVWDEKTK